MKNSEELQDLQKKEIKQLNEQICLYVPYNDQERADKERIQKALNTDRLMELFSRKNPFAHMTASAWVVSQNREKALMVYHRLYDSWSWLGGHADGEFNLLNVALREVKEESGLTRVKPVSDRIYSLEVLPVNGHEKNGVYVSSHLHLNLTYLLEADESEELCIKKEENSGAAWFGLWEAADASSEPWLKKRIYPKLIEKLHR